MQTYIVKQHSIELWSCNCHSRMFSQRVWNCVVGGYMVGRNMVTDVSNSRWQKLKTNITFKNSTYTSPTSVQVRNRPITYFQGDHSFPKSIFHDFSMTKKRKSMTYRHKTLNIFPNKRHTTYECLRELLVTVAAACSSVVNKIKSVVYSIYTCSQIFHNSLSNTTSFVALELLQLLLQLFFNRSHFCTLLLRWSSETVRLTNPWHLVGLFSIFSIFISWGC